jgi:hypothetical protein
MAEAQLTGAHIMAGHSGREIKLDPHGHTQLRYTRNGEVFMTQPAWVAARIEDGPMTITLCLTPAGAREWAAELLAAADVAEGPARDTNLDAPQPEVP